MGSFRFRKVVSLGRYLKLNLSKTGASVSVGRPGATLNVRKDRVDGTVGLPGTGLSYRERLSNRGCATLFVGRNHHASARERTRTFTPLEGGGF
jgi:Protein of unknown function (DUF4236)